MARQLSLVIVLIVSMAGYSFAQPASVTSGINWLIENQKVDKSWGGEFSSASTFNTTAAAIYALRMCGTAESSVSDGLNWLHAQKADSVVFIADRLLVNTLCGASATSDLNQLVAWRNNIDGAWGLDSEYSNDIVEVALALQALQAANYSDTTVLYQAINFLTTNQNTDGGWGFYKGNSSNVYMTAIVSAALQQFPQTTTLATAISKATSYLSARQNADGGFGSSPSSVYETSLTFKALFGVTTDATVLGRAVNYLTATQLANGSWKDDPYSTALALKALHLAETRPSTPPPTSTTGTVNGTVVDGSTNQPLGGVSVILTGNTAIAALTDSIGSFSLANIPQGSQQIAFSLNGYATSTATVPMIAGSIMNIGSVPLTVVLTTGIIQGTITDASNGSALSGVTITVAGTTTWTATTSSDGTFKITGIAPGNITISANKSGYTTVSTTSMVTAGGTLTFSPSLTVPPPAATTGGVTGKVIDSATGLPLQGATISVAGVKGYTASTDSSGSFVLSSVDAGSYIVTVSSTGYGTQTYTVTIIAGTTTNLGSVALTMNAATGMVKGKVTDASTGLPIPGAAITVTGSTAWTAVTLADGSYTVASITPGASRLGKTPHLAQQNSQDVGLLCVAQPT